MGNDYGKVIPTTGILGKDNSEQGVLGTESEEACLCGSVRKIMVPHRWHDYVESIN
jgi:hypothetical protein